MQVSFFSMHLFHFIHKEKRE